MENPRFIDQYNKIVKAYLRCELSSTKAGACFVGTLMNNCSEWRFFRYGLINPHNHEQAVECLTYQANGFYSPEELMGLEDTFMGWKSPLNESDPPLSDMQAPNYEDRLFRAMERALLHLRQIHESKGEIIEDYGVKRRDLAMTQ